MVALSEELASNQQQGTDLVRPHSTVLGRGKRDRNSVNAFLCLSVPHLKANAVSQWGPGRFTQCHFDPGRLA